MGSQYLCSLVALSLCLAVTITIGDDKEAIEARVQAAEQESEGLISKSLQNLKQSLEAKRDAAQSRGDLAAYEELATELQNFDRRGVLPKSVSTKAYERASQKAVSDLERVYRFAVTEATKVGNIALAKELQKRQDGLETRRVGRPSDAALFRGHAYKLFSEKLSWSEARTRCNQMGGHLATIHDRDEHAFILHMAANTTVSQIWLGGTDESQEGTWKWVTDEEFGYSDWGPSEPNNLGNAEHSLVLIKDLNGDPAWRGKWSDQPADSGNHPGFVCEWE